MSQTILNSQQEKRGCTGSSHELGYKGIFNKLKGKP